MPRRDSDDYYNMLQRKEPVNPDYVDERRRDEDGE